MGVLQRNAASPRILSMAHLCICGLARPSFQCFQPNSYSSVLSHFFLLPPSLPPFFPTSLSLFLSLSQESLILWWFHTYSLYSDMHYLNKLNVLMGNKEIHGMFLIASTLTRDPRLISTENSESFLYCRNIRCYSIEFLSSVPEKVVVEMSITQDSKAKVKNNAWLIWPVKIHGVTIRLRHYQCREHKEE